MAAADLRRHACSSIMVTWRTGVDAVRAALVQTPEAGERFLADLKSRRDPARAGHDRLSDPQHAKSVAAHHGSCAFRRRAAAKCHRAQHRVRKRAAHRTDPTARWSMTWARAYGTSWPASVFSKFRICGRRSARREGLATAVDFDKAMFIGTRDLVVRKLVAPALTGLADGAVRLPLSQFGQNRRSVQSCPRQRGRNRAPNRDLGLRAHRSFRRRLPFQIL